MPVTISPTSIQQADRDLKRRVISYLFGKHLPGLRHLAVEACNGTVTLRGRVRTFHEKQLCQSCSRRVAGVVRLIDDIHVIDPAAPPSTQAMPLADPLGGVSGCCSADPLAGG